MGRPRKRPADAALPRVSKRLLGLFRRYARYYIRRHFNAVRLSRAGRLPALPAEPLVVYVNHPSWWDPMIGLLAGTELLGDRPQYAPIDAAMLERYRFFGRLGFFGVEPGTARGARTLLATADAVFAVPRAVLWITPEGRFTDPRERPVRFQSGLAAVASRLPCGRVLPMALEYPFWEERQPEALVRFGRPLAAPDIRARTRREINAMLEARMAATQDALAEEAVARDPAAFETLLAGKAGVGLVYDAWRWIKARVRGRSFDPHHGARRA